MHAVVIKAEPMVVTVEVIEPKVIAEKIDTPYRVVVIEPALITTVVAVGGNSLSAIPNDFNKDGVLAGV